MLTYEFYNAASLVVKKKGPTLRCLSHRLYRYDKQDHSCTDAPKGGTEKAAKERPVRRR